MLYKRAAYTTVAAVALVALGGLWPIRTAAATTTLKPDHKALLPPQDVATTPPKQLKGVGLKTKLGAELPLDVTFTDSTGKSVRLGSLFQPGVPVILTFNYSNCPMLCSLQLGALVDAMNKIDLIAGRQFRIVTIVIDPKETPAQAARTKAEYLKRYKMPHVKNGWRFLTGGLKPAHTVANAVGFHYRYDPKKGQVYHPAADILVSPDGTVSSYLYGVHYDPKKLTKAIHTAGMGGSLKSAAAFVLSCCLYTPPRGHARTAFGVMRVAAFAFLFSLVGAFATFRIVKTRRNHRGQPSRDDRGE